MPGPAATELSTVSTVTAFAIVEKLILTVLPLRLQELNAASSTAIAFYYHDGLCRKRMLRSVRVGKRSLQPPYMHCSWILVLNATSRELLRIRVLDVYVDSRNRLTWKFGLALCACQPDERPQQSKPRSQALAWVPRSIDTCILRHSA